MIAVLNNYCPLVLFRASDLGLFPREILRFLASSKVICPGKIGTLGRPVQYCGVSHTLGTSCRFPLKGAVQPDDILLHTYCF